MSVLHLDSNNFEETIKSTDKPVLVDFWAEWCAPCRMFGPIFEKAAEKLDSEAVFAKINVDESEDLALKYSVMSIPTVILFKNGAEAARKTGALSLGEIAALLK